MKTEPAPAATRHPGRASVVLLTAAAYAAVALAALSLSASAGWASPLYPSAGLALAAAMVWGRWSLPGVFLGSWLANAGLGLMMDLPAWKIGLLPIPIALGAAVQGAVGAALLRRHVSAPFTLSSPRDIAMAGALGAGLACCISASSATLALWLWDQLPPAGMLGNWLTWWLGDALGVLIATPLVLTLIGLPREDWRPRRLSLGLPLLVALLLLAGGILELRRVEAHRLQASFDRDALRLSSAMQQSLAVPKFALQALHGLALTRGEPDARSMQTLARLWLQQDLHLRAMGYSVRVPASGVAAFEARARAEGETAYQVTDRDDGSARRSDGEVLAIRQIEPRPGNQGALGVNALSLPAARQAILAARDSGAPAATAGFRIAQATGEETGVVLYQALYDGPDEPETPQMRQQAFRAVVFVTVNADGLLARLPEQAYLQWCLIDPAPQSGSLRLAGKAGCDSTATPAGHFAAEHMLELGGRPLRLLIHAEPDLVPVKSGETAWLVSMVGLAASALMGALLLTITGQRRLTERAVQAGTAELRHEMAERAQAEAALRDSEARLRSILDHLPVGVTFLEPDGRVLECNPRLCDMLGRQADDLLGANVRDLVHPEDRPQVMRQRRELLRGHEVASIGPVRLVHGRQEERFVRVSASALRNEKGRVIRMVGVLEDVTEMLRLEASDRALQRAEAANRAKSEFLSRMSHELRTPLNAMIGFNQLLEMQSSPPLTKQQKEWVQQSLRAGWHLLEMINETLDLARIESGRLQLNLQPVLLPAMVNTCKAMMESAAQQHGIVLSERLAPRAAAVLADSTRLRQVLINLLSNAIKYNKPAGRVMLTTQVAADGLIEIEVRDTGMGMNAEQLAALFQPYNRLGREQADIEGTGIGLVISRRLTELMGGTLTVQSQAGVGSAFTVRLPAAAVESAETSTGSLPVEAAYRQRLVHYVEDNETNVEVMRGVLTRRPQVVLEVSALGLDGLAAIRQRRPDLILLDMHLPDISGLELLRHIKQDPEVTDIPVVVVSADATPSHVERALTLGAAHYVTKPLSLKPFLQMLDEVLEDAQTRI